MTGAQVSAFVGARESFEVIQNYMDAAVGVVDSAAHGTLKYPSESPFTFPNPFNDFADGLKKMVAGTNIREPTKTIDGHNFFDLPGTTLDGKKIKKMGDLCKGKKAILIVNVASNCALTDQNYEGLVDIYNQYKKMGLEIIAYPSN